MVLYSHSKISTFEKCKLKYKFRYIDKIKPEIKETIESHLGRCVHETLEWLYSKILKGKIPSIDETIVHYTEVWKEKFSQEIVIVNHGMTDKDYFEKGVRFLLDYYLTHRPFDDNTLELEKRITVKIHDEETQEQYKLQGFIDRVALNKETQELEIHDYKTSGTLPNTEQINSDRQLALYSIAIKEIFEVETVALIWHYLNFNKKISIKKNEEELENLKSEIIKSIKQIESETEFPANKSVLCKWCEYKKQCPIWKNYDWKIDIKPEKPKPKENTDDPTNQDDSSSQKIQSLSTNQSPSSSEEVSTKEKYPTLMKYLKD